MTDALVIACTDARATADAGQRLATCVRPGDLIGLVGDLGAGKTVFVQGLARGLGVPPSVRVTSPTFTLINEYHGGSIPLYHADLYRLERERELDELGLDELCRRGDGIVAVEWSDRFRALPADHLDLCIDIGSAEQRLIRVVGRGPRSVELAAAFATCS